MALANQVATVTVKSGWLSKINWLQIVGAILTLVTTNAFGLDAATQVKVMAVTNVLQGIATVVIKTWFTPTVTSQSL